MEKPDWAERLQRSRKREYEKGWADSEERIVSIIEHFITDWRVVGFTQAPQLFEILIALIKKKEEND